MIVYCIAGCDGLSWMQGQITSQNLCRWCEPFWDFSSAWKLCCFNIALIWNSECSNLIFTFGEMHDSTIGCEFISCFLSLELSYWLFPITFTVLCTLNDLLLEYLEFDLICYIREACYFEQTCVKHSEGIFIRQLILESISI